MIENEKAKLDNTLPVPKIGVKLMSEDQEEWSKKIRMVGRGN